MGNKAEARFEFIQEKAAFAKRGVAGRVSGGRLPERAERRRKFQRHAPA